MKTDMKRRALALLLVLTACSGAQADRDEPVAEPAEREEALEQPRASGASAYVPQKERLPEGAIDRALLDRALAAGPGWLLSEVPLQPTFLAKHKFGGFKLVSVFRNDPKVLRYGVLPGDVLRSVNAQRIVTPGDLLLVFERLKTANALDIVVQRDGVDREFHFPILPLLAIEPPAVTPDIAPPDPAR
jgi:type II secretory pathway component PulC